MQIIAENTYPLRRIMYHCHYRINAKVKILNIVISLYLYNCKTLSIALNKKQTLRLLDTVVLRTYLGNIEKLKQDGGMLSLLATKIIRTEVWCLT